MQRTAEILDCGSDGEMCWKTGAGAVFVGAEECAARLADLQRLDVGPEGRFLVDWQDENGNILETFGLDAAGFEALVGHAPASTEDYEAYDMDYWTEQRAAREPDHGHHQEVEDLEGDEPAGERL